jgi:hypothetical protein
VTEGSHRSAVWIPIAVAVIGVLGVLGSAFIQTLDTGGKDEPVAAVAADTRAQRSQPQAETSPVPSPPASAGGTTPTPTAMPREGAVLLEDAFDNLARRLMPESDDNSSRFAYLDGEYQVSLKEGRRDTSLVVNAVPQVVDDARIAVDVRIVGDYKGRMISIMCRSSENNGIQVGYDFQVVPDSSSSDSSGVFTIRKQLVGAESDVYYIYNRPSAAIYRNNRVNRLEMSCVDNQVIVWANGNELGRIVDAQKTFTSGRFAIGAGFESDNTTAPADVRFDNLKVLDR